MRGNQPPTPSHADGSRTRHPARKASLFVCHMQASLSRHVASATDGAFHSQRGVHLPACMGWASGGSFSPCLPRRPWYRLLILVYGAKTGGGTTLQLSRPARPNEADGGFGNRACSPESDGDRRVAVIKRALRCGTVVVSDRPDPEATVRGTRALTKCQSHREKPSFQTTIRHSHPIARANFHCSTCSFKALLICGMRFVALHHAETKQ